MQRMHAFNSAFSFVHVKPAILEINLSPSQRTKLLSPQAMPIGQEDSRCIPCAIPPSLACSLDQPINFLLGQMFVFGSLWLAMCQSWLGWPRVIEVWIGECS
jgi:hypothetical protein